MAMLLAIEPCRSGSCPLLCHSSDLLCFLLILCHLRGCVRQKVNCAVLGHLSSNDKHTDSIFTVVPLRLYLKAGVFYVPGQLVFGEYENIG